jgi:hypothetical protein
MSPYIELLSRSGAGRQEGSPVLLPPQVGGGAWCGCSLPLWRGLLAREGACLLATAVGALGWPGPTHPVPGAGRR